MPTLRSNKKKATKMASNTNETQQQASDNQPSLQQIMDKLKLLEKIDTKLDNINIRVEAVEDRVATIENDQTEITSAIEVIQADLRDGAPRRDVSHLKEKLQEAEDRLEELENRDRRFNIRILGWKLNTEDRNKCKQVSDWLYDLGVTSNEDHVAVTKVYQITRPQSGGQNAHTVIATLQLPGEDHAGRVISTANKKLRQDRGYGRVLITDDVCQQTRRKRQRLLPKMHDLRQKGLLALIPFSTPARMVYKEGDKWHTILPDIETTRD